MACLLNLGLPEMMECHPQQLKLECNFNGSKMASTGWFFQNIPKCSKPQFFLLHADDHPESSLLEGWDTGCAWKPRDPRDPRGAVVAGGWS
jgi:hypothetical protein